jgi:membrane-associated HD superfamily phosphohydrolase
MQKYNLLQKNPLKETKILQDIIITLTCHHGYNLIEFVLKKKEKVDPHSIWEDEFFF